MAGPRLPHPGAPGHFHAPPAPPVAPAESPQPPAMLVAAAVATMVGSLVWLTGFSLVWLVLFAAMGSINEVEGFSGAYHVINRFHLNLVGGGALPAYLLPSVALVLGALLLIRRPWIRIATTIWAIVAVVWSALWQWNTPALWVPGAFYIGLVMLALWLPSVSRWYRDAASSATSRLAQAPPPARMSP